MIAFSKIYGLSSDVLFSLSYNEYKKAGLLNWSKEMEESMHPAMVAARYHRDMVNELSDIMRGLAKQRDVSAEDVENEIKELIKEGEMNGLRVAKLMSKVRFTEPVPLEDTLKG